MLPIAMEIECETDERSNLFDRLQSLACFEEFEENDKDETENVSSNLTNEIGTELRNFKTPSNREHGAITENEPQNEKTLSSNKNATNSMQIRSTNEHKYDAVDGLNFFIKSELPDDYDEERQDSLPNGSALGSCSSDAGPSSAAIEYEPKISTSDDDPFELLTISKRQAAISIHTVKVDFVPPVRKRGRKKKSFVTESFEQIVKDIKKPPKQTRTRRISPLPGPFHGKTKDTSKSKSATIFSSLSDVGSVDDVLNIWEAKMELQAACGFTASENLSADQVAIEARSRIESLHYQFTSACATSKQLLREQYDLAKRISNPLGLDEVSLVRKKRIRPKYAELIAKGLMLPPQDYNRNNPNSFF